MNWIKPLINSQEIQAADDSLTLGETMSKEILLAFDLGASSGRAITGEIDVEHKKIKLQEIHRFPNSPIRVNNHLYWSILALWSEIKRSLVKAFNQYGNKVVSVGVDTWGVDYGLIGSNGELIAIPRSYRDPSNLKAMKTLLSKISREKIYMRTGIQFTPINTLYQIYSRLLETPELFTIAKTFLMIPDIFNYWLSGIKAAEFTEASTTQFLDPRKRNWSYEILEELGLPTNIFPEVIEPGTLLGKISKGIVDELGISPEISVIAPATHDTAAAVAAAPINENSAYISSGTWSLVGVELNEPIINKQSLENNFTNEGGAFNTITFLRNIQGMWFIQEIKRVLELRGEKYTYEELTKMAAEAEGNIAYIDPDNPRFLAPKNMITEISKYLEETGQRKPSSIGELVRLVLESLALKYRFVLERVSDLTGRRIKEIAIFGGGSKNWLHNQLVSDFTDKPVIAGPSEATATGNLLIQAVGLGYIRSLRELREYVRNSFNLRRYEPNHSSIHDDAYNKFLELTEETE